MDIQTERLIIRSFKPADAKRVQEVCNDYDIAKTTLSLPIPYTIDHAKAFIEYTINSAKENISYEGAICFKDNPEKVIGCIGITNINKIAKRAELGWWVAKEEWNKGIATEAAKAIINFAFDKLKLHTLCARHFENNPASGRVMQKSGMSFVGKMRDYESRLGEYHNVLYYDIVDSEFNFDNKNK
ncbi:MAG: GNAT family N-acetyltransferase [Clostridia bacterium]|nr:GNAT family N-acetyltransferase [Clostridia bacterium]